MNKYILLSQPTASGSFTEASQEELRVLVAIMEAREPLSAEQITETARVSTARAKGAIAFWEAEGVIAKAEHQSIIDEFPERLRAGEITEEPAVSVAQSIRDENLRGLFEEFAIISEKPALTQNEIKILAALVTQYALTEEYLLELSAHLKSKSKLTAALLRDRATELISRGIDNTEALSVYIKDMERRSASEQEFRRLLGLYNRTLSEKEQQLFTKWGDEFGYSTTIVGEAYSITVLNTGKLSLPYMDKVLSAWHEAGCKTLEECRAVNAQKSAEEKKNTERKRTKSEAPKPRYGDFDVNDAFAKALERSYNTDKK